MFPKLLIVYKQLNLIKMAKELKKTDLVAAHDEIDKVVGIVPPLKETLKQDKYEKDLYTTIVNDLELSTAEIKEFSKKTQEVIKALKEKYAKADDEDEDEEDEDNEPEIAAPAKKSAKAPVVEEEDEEDEDDEDDEEEEEDEDEELSLVDQVLACRKKGDYIELINTSPEFKKDKKRLLAISSVFSLKKEMLAVVSPAKKAPVVVDDDDDEEEAEEIKPTKKSAKTVLVKKEKKAKVERPASIEWPEGFAKEDVVTFLNKKEEKITGTLKKYFWHKQSARFWYVIDVDGKDCYKHVEDVTKAKKAKK